MEGYAHRSRSRFRAPQPPTAGGPVAAAFSSRKLHTNGGGGPVSGYGFTAYDDVFGGPPKFGAGGAPFAPRAEDYFEIFGSSLSSRASSIPMLDLPPVDDSVAAFDVDGAGYDYYSDVFGGLEFFAVPYDELFGRFDSEGESSDDAWTPAATESVSEESDPSAGSERNHCLQNEDLNQSLESKQFNVSYHRVNSGAREDPVFTHVAQFGAVPGYTCVVNESSSHKDGGARHGYSAVDNVILREDSSGNLPAEHSSIPSHDHSGKHLNESDNISGRANKASTNTQGPNAVSDSHVDGRAKSSMSPEPSRPLHQRMNNLDDHPNLTTDIDDSKSFADERISESSSPLFYDVELEVSPSAMASVAAMQEAMQMAQEKMKNARELMDRKVSHNGTMPGVKNALNGEVRARMSFDESLTRHDVLQSTYEVEHGESRNSWEGNTGSRETLHPSLESLREERDFGAAVRSKGKNVKNHTSPLNPDAVGGEGEWKEASQYIELVGNDSFQTESMSVDNFNKLDRELNNGCFVNGIGKPVVIEQQEEADGIIGAANYPPEGEEDEESELCEAELELRDNRRRFRPVKTTSRQEFHEKMVKVALEVHERVICDSTHIEKKKKEDWEGDGNGNDRKLETWAHVVKNERTDEDTSQQSGTERKHEEVPFEPGSEGISEEASSPAESDKKKKDLCKGVDGIKMKVALELVDNKKREKEVRQSYENTEDCVSKEKWKKEGSLDSLACNTFQLKGDREVDVRAESPESGMSGYAADNEEGGMVEEISPDKDGKDLKELRNMGQHAKDIEKAAIADCRDENLNDSVDLKKFKKHEVRSNRKCALENNIEVADKLSFNRSYYDDSKEETANASELEKNDNVHSDTDNIIKHQDESRIDPEIHLENKEPDSHSREMNAESGNSTSSNALLNLDDKISNLFEECKDFQSANFDAQDVKDTTVHELDCACEEQSRSYAAQKMCENKETGQCGTQPLVAENELKTAAAEMADSTSMSVEHISEAPQHMMPERKEPIEKRSQSISTSQRDGLEGLATKSDLTAEDGEKTERLKTARELEEERLRKLEEEREREREREKDRMGVELGIGERAFAEARERAEKAAVDRAASEARQRAMAEARERLEKACAEARGNCVTDKASAEASRWRAERAAVERATAEERERAMEKAKVERGSYGVSEQLERSAFDKLSGTRHSSLSSNSRNDDKLDGVEGETAERCRARLERHRRTVERVAKALAEKNMRDLIAQREQAERNRFAETLDADIKRWSSGKEGNLRALLSTLQYILGPDSGWHPIPLTEVITSVAVKKAYRKATLCVHPDKLQQRGATIQQKYVCEKVFDLLKDAWNKFNSEEI